MGADDWTGLIEQAAAAKINMIQLMGADHAPALHPDHVPRPGSRTRR
jgi:hypothetical protein